MNKNKILLVGNYYNKNGGISALISSLAIGLKNEKYNVAIYTTANRFIQKRIFNCLKLFFEIKKFDIIHAHGCSSFGILPIVISYVYSLIFKKKILITFHGSVDNAPRIANNFFFKYILNINIKITTPTPITAEQFIISGFKAVSIPNIFDNKNWHFKVRLDFAPKFICLRSKYNPSIIIDTFEDIQKKYPDAKLYMLGKFNDKDTEKKAKRNKAIHVVGNIDRSDVFVYLDKADFYINSCNNDSFGYSIYEAIASGLCVVSVKSDSVEKLIGKDIVKFSNNYDNKLTAEVNNLLEDKEQIKERVEKGKNFIASLMWDRLKNKWIELYDNL